MKNLICLSVLGMALAGCVTAPTDTAELTPLLVTNQPGDADLSCEDITVEMASMDVMMAQAHQNAANAEASGTAANTATSAAVNTALYSGALGRVPGLGMAANAVGGMAQQRAQAEAERQAENARRAEMRRTALSGIAVGKGC